MSTSSRSMRRLRTSLTFCRSRANTSTSHVRTHETQSCACRPATKTLAAFPWISGAEFAGIVLATPANSKKPKYPIGTRVFGATQGAYATKTVAKETNLLPIPDGFSYKDAAGLFVTAPTSYGALVVRAGIKAGDYVLVHAAAGGVGLAAVQGILFLSYPLRTSRPAVCTGCC